MTKIHNEVSRKRSFLFTFLILFICFGLASNGFAQQSSLMPKWLQEHMTYITQGTGRWITDNSKYKGEKEQSDEYGTEWEWGVRRRSIKGRLFGLKDKKEVATFWEYRLFWHPKEHRAILQQFGGNGVFGIGEMRYVKTDKHSEIMTEMTFYSPNGKSWKDLHRVTGTKDKHQTSSFFYKDGSWREKRNYTWIRSRSKPTKTNLDRAKNTYE